MKQSLMAATAVSLVLSLGGCSGVSFFDFKSSSSASTPRDGPIDMSGYFVRRLNDGKIHLKEGRLGRAADAFRQASHFAGTSGEAFNGLAITYDRLGRSDLARQYFEQAMAFAPDNEMYARNFARFEGKLHRAQAEKSKLASSRATSEQTPRKIAKLAKSKQEETRVFKPVADLEPQKRSIVEAQSPPAGASLRRASPPVSLQAAPVRISELEAAPVSVKIAAMTQVAEKPFEIATQAVTPVVDVAQPSVRPVVRVVTARPGQAQAADTVRSGFVPRPRITVDTARVQMVRVSRNEVVISRGAPTNHANADTAISPNRPVSTAADADTDPDDGSTVSVDPGHAGVAVSDGFEPNERTQLALADTWKSCTSGC